MVSVPSASLAYSSPARRRFCASARMRSAIDTTALPGSVTETRRLPWRANTWMPSSSSSARICFDTTGCDVSRAAIGAVWGRVWPIIIGLLPGVALGSYLLAALHPDWLKLGTYMAIVPLILLQAAGVRRPISAERAVGVPFGAGLGFLYSVTT